MPSFGPSAQEEDNKGAASSRLINCYLQPVMGRGRTSSVLRSVLGTEAFAVTSRSFFAAAHEFQGDLFAVYDSSLFKITSAGAVSEVGSVAGGNANISSNNSYLTIAAGGAFFTHLGTTQARTVTPLADVGSVGYLDQYTLVTERSGRKWAWSDLADPTTFPALNFASAEATDDNLLRVIGVNGRVILFKQFGREIWYNTGQSGANAFSRMAGGAKNIGLKGFDLVTKTDEALFYLGSDNIARITLDGFSEKKFSYPPVDAAIANDNPTECFYYEDEGQKFCVIRFGDRPAWVLDLATGLWHERADGKDHAAWGLRGTAKLGDVWYGFTDSGAVLKLLRNNTDTAGMMRRTAVSETFYAEEGATLDELEIYARTGFNDLGRDAQMWVRLSRDGGHTWTLEKWRSLGTEGNYRQKAAWKAQGRFQQLTIEANISDPAEIPIWTDFLLEAA